MVIMQIFVIVRRRAPLNTVGQMQPIVGPQIIDRLPIVDGIKIYY